MTDIRATIGLPPDDIVAYFRAKGTYPPSVSWTDVWQEEHVRAFTVAKVLDRTLLESIRASLDTVIAKGGTFEGWKKTILPVLKDRGWWGKVRYAELTGTEKPVLVDSRRLRTIFDTNVRMARAAGRWKKIQDAKDVAPYLRYSAVMDGRTRPLHRAWHATILHVDHPWWDDHFPPNGWNCRCTVTQHGERDLRLRGWTVSETPPQDGPARAFRRRSGATETVPAGIDPGFAYNVGKHHMRGLAPAPVDRPLSQPAIPAELPPMPEPRRRDPTLLLPAETPKDVAVQRFMDRFDGPTDGISKLSRDVAGEPLVLDDRFFDHFLGSDRGGGRLPSIDLLAEALADPDEIWWTWEQPGGRDGNNRFETPRIRRRYVTRFDVGDRTRFYSVIVEIAPDGWTGVTAFVARSESYADGNLRGGVLAYRRADPASDGAGND